MCHYFANLLCGWQMVADLPAPRRRRFRLAFVLHFFGLRRLASLVSGIDP
jgi:hypothetical protein